MKTLCFFFINFVLCSLISSLLVQASSVNPFLSSSVPQYSYNAGKSSPDWVDSNVISIDSKVYLRKASHKAIIREVLSGTIIACNH